jgi:hypothetical protein
MPLTIRGVRERGGEVTSCNETGEEDDSSSTHESVQRGGKPATENGASKIRRRIDETGEPRSCRLGHIWRFEMEFDSIKELGPIHNRLIHSLDNARHTAHNCHELRSRADTYQQESTE